jgi:folate-binding protein YgfZ
MSIAARASAEPVSAGLSAITVGVSTSEGAFGTGVNSARIALGEPHETPSKTKMSKSLAVDLSTMPAGLGVLAFRGVDAARFLQGQLSSEIETLQPGESTLSGLHNPQGRCIALLTIVRATHEELLAVLPRELAAPVLERLRKYVFRSKLGIEDWSEKFTVLGVAAVPAETGGMVPLDWGSDRKLLLVAPERRGDFTIGDAAALAAWTLADVAAGIPQVYAATSETFVAQMLNLDLLGAISFDKGCYTGQEVIARAHYRGRVKRRLQRWRTAGSPWLKPGDAVRSADGRTLTVVTVVSVESNGQELLAVGAFAPVDAGAAADGEAVGNTSLPVVDGPLSLPYTLPE